MKGIGYPKRIKVYDSDWFAVSLGSTVVKTHDLGSTKIIVALYFATSDVGANMETVNLAVIGTNPSDTYGGNIQNITTTQLTVQAGYVAVQCGLNSSGELTGSAADGFYRVIAMKLN